MKKKIALIVLTAVLLICCAAGSVSRRFVPRDELEETVRAVYSLSEDEHLEYAGLAGSGSKVLVWYIGGEDGPVCYPVSFHAFGRKKNIYFFDEAFAPVSGTVVCQQWNGGVAYLDGTEKGVPVVGFQADAAAE